MGTIHPTFTSKERATMSVSELLFFTDEPVAHAAAFRDFQRDQQRDIHIRAAARAAQMRNHAIASFFREAYA